MKTLEGSVNAHGHGGWSGNLSGFLNFTGYLRGLFYRHKKILKFFIWMNIFLLAIFLLLNIFLWVFQKGKLPLNAKVQNVNLSLKTPDEAKELLQELDLQKLNIDANGNFIEANLGDLGAAVDVDGVINDLNTSSGIFRLPLIKAIAFSMINHAPKYEIDQQKAIGLFESIGQKYNLEPTNAAIKLPGSAEDEIIIESDKDGFNVDPKLTALQLTNNPNSLGQSTIELKPGRIKAKITSKDLQPEKERMATLLLHNTAMYFEQKRFEPDQDQRLSFLTIEPNEEGIPRGSYNKENIKSYIKNVVLPDVYKAPTYTVVNLVDGVQSSQTAGVSGLTVNVDETTDAYIQAWQEKQPSVEIKMQSIAPKVIYNRAYSYTNEGLHQLIKDFASEYSGEYQVVVKDLTNGFSASLNAGSSTVPASTYKVFLAYVALKKIEQGSLSFDVQTGYGSVSYCIEQMIVISDNNCAKAILNTIGWAETDRVIHEAGFSSTNLNNSGGGYMSTTAQDEANMMEKLYNGSLLTSANRDFLFGFMNRQIYRSGIPAGSKGSVVTDKVGFLESWNHDMAIVHSPKSTYVLIVMSKYSSFSNISVLASRVYDFFN